MWGCGVRGPSNNERAKQTRWLSKQGCRRFDAVRHDAARRGSIQAAAVNCTGGRPAAVRGPTTGPTRLHTGGRRDQPAESCLSTHRRARDLPRTQSPRTAGRGLSTAEPRDTAPSRELHSATLSTCQSWPLQAASANQPPS